MSKSPSSALADPPVNVNLKLAGLWAATMFLYLYNDLFTLYRPGQLQVYLSGNLGPMGHVNQWLLLGFAASIAPPTLMIYLSLVLPPKANRWANIGWGLIFSVLNAGFGLMDGWYYYKALGAIEVVLTALVVWHAWTWPRRDPASDSSPDW